METRILEMKNITKKFVGTVALKDVSVYLHQGEILAILGENGAGKSTLMKILSGVYPAGSYEGEILLSGKPVRFLNTKESEGAGIAMIHQEINLELDLSIAENILLGRLPKNRLGLVDWEKVALTAEALLMKLGVRSIDVRMPVRNLNASMQQLVSIARALSRDPKILILDEPTSCLTEVEAENLMKVIKTLGRQGISCLYISHKLNEVFALCDRVVVLRDGSHVSEYMRNQFDGSTIVKDIVGEHIEAVHPPEHSEIGEEVLRVEHFRVLHPFTYGKNIISDVSFSLHRGEALGICGLVGSGRSELLSAIFGAIPKISGDVYIDGKLVDIRHPADAKRNGIGMLTEDRRKNGFISCLSIRENTTITILRKIAKYFYINQSVERNIVNHFISKLHIKASSMETRISMLSGGNQQKVIVAKWLATELKILFFDEPTRGIDVGAKAEIYSLIHELTQKGVAVVLISSELQELISLCDRLLILSGGVVQGEYPRGALTEADILHKCSNL